MIEHVHADAQGLCLDFVQRLLAGKGLVLNLVEGACGGAGCIHAGQTDDQCDDGSKANHEQQARRDGDFHLRSPQRYLPFFWMLACYRASLCILEQHFANNTNI